MVYLTECYPVAVALCLEEENKLPSATVKLQPLKRFPGYQRFFTVNFG